jgi:hypothetical protein
MKIIQSKIITNVLLGVSGIVLYPFIFVNDKNNKVLINHERIHEAQIRDHGVFGFYWKYITDWIRAGFKYRKIPFEIEAFKFQDDMNYLKRRESRKFKL